MKKLVTALFFIIIGCSEDSSVGNMSNSNSERTATLDQGFAQISGIKLIINTISLTSGDTSFLKLDSIKKIELYVNGNPISGRYILKSPFLGDSTIHQEQFLELNISDTLNTTYRGADIVNLLDGNIEIGTHYFQIGRIFGYKSGELSEFIVNKTFEIKVDEMTKSLSIGTIWAVKK